MKKYAVSLHLVLFVLFSVNLATAQNADFAFATVSIETSKVAHLTEHPAKSNVADVLSEISRYLDGKIEFPERYLEFYNSDVTVVATFSIAENGKLENISIEKGADKILGDIVVKELNKISDVSPVLENGTPVHKGFKIPVVFKIQ